MALGQLVVRLGLDAADFTSGMTKSEAQAKRFADSLSNQVAIGVAKAEIALKALEKAFDFAVHAIPDLIEQAGKFQELAEKTGIASDALASMSASAKAGGIDMDIVAKASEKLSLGLAKVSDNSTGAGAALKAIGLPFKEFKALDPGAQIEAVAKAMSGFQDGAGKTAVAMLLFGKAGADMLPFLKQMGEGIGRINILTAEQIKTANEWSSAHAKGRAELNAYAQALATEMIPAMTAVENAVKGLIKEFLGLDGTTKDLKASGVILDWAETAAVAIATVVEAAIGAGKAIYAIGGSFQSVYADAKLLSTLTPGGAAIAAAQGETIGSLLDKRNKAAADANQRYADLWNYDGTKITTAIKKSFDEQRKALAAGPKGAEGKKPAIDTSGLATDAAGNAEALLKKQLEGQLKLIRDWAEQQKAAYAFANQYLSGVYDAGLTSQADYFEKQKALRDAALAAEVKSLDDQIAVEKAALAKTSKPQDRQAIENKIADAVQQRALAVQKASQTDILATQEEAKAVKALSYTYYDFLANVKSLQGDAAGASALKIAKQQQDAQELLTKLGFDPAEAKKQAEAYGVLLTQVSALAQAQTDYGRLVESARVKEKESLLASQLAGDSELETLTKIGAIRQGALADLKKQVDLAEQLAAVSKDPAAVLNAEKLALAFKEAAAQADPLFQKIKDIGREMGDAIGSRFEDALLAKGVSLRDRFKNLITGIGDDITKTLTHNLITKPISDWLSNAIGGNGTASGGGGILGALGIFGVGKGAGQASDTAGLAAHTAALTTGTTAMAALTSAASSAAAALAALGGGSAASGGGGLLGFLGGFSGYGGAAVGSMGATTGMGEAGMFAVGFAGGGTALPGSIHQVNEQGPELLDVNGRSFLMMGNQRGQVTPLSKGGGGGTNIYVSVAMPAGGSRQTAMQFGRDAARQLAVAHGRNG